MTSGPICIIGAGAAGLCAARHLAPLKEFQPVVYEQTSSLGGTWVYNPKTGVDENGLAIHSSMYKGLKTNLPKEVMAFPDFPFRENKDSFLHHSQVLQYLESYAQHYDLHRHIHLRTVVKRVAARTGDEDGFDVTVEHLQTGETSTRLFKAVMVCNGHYSVPSLPQVEGLQHFRGRIMHSHDYREPGPFENLTVAVLGAAASGTDIGIEISSLAKRVFLCHNNPELPSNLPRNLEQRKGIEKVLESGQELQLSDGSSIDGVDVILFCTGYHYSFPFLDEACHPKVENRVVWPLYKHMIHVQYPRMCFIGIPIQICPFPQFDLQVRFFVKTLQNAFPLPSKELMIADTEQEMKGKQSCGIAEKHFHKMGPSQWDYNRILANLADLKPISDAVEKLYNDVWTRRRHNLTTYKNESFRRKSGDSEGGFERVE